MLSCDRLPPEAACPGPAPPKPVPMSPRGPVRDVQREYWDSGSTDSENGLYEVAATPPGTFAETGIVHDVRPGRDVPVEGARVTYTTVQVGAVEAPPGGPVEVTTSTGYGGAFAFVDMPAAAEGTCYRLVITAPGLGRYEAIDLIEPGVYDHSALELDGGSHRESHLDQTRSKSPSSKQRTCAARAGR